MLAKVAIPLLLYAKKLLVAFMRKCGLPPIFVLSGVMKGLNEFLNTMANLMKRAIIVNILSNGTLMWEPLNS